jgi:hypothetical protein
MRRKVLQGAIDYWLCFSRWVECRPDSSGALLVAGGQCTQQNCLMLLWLADNLPESPSAAINAEQGIQMLRFFKIWPVFLMLEQS